MKYEHPGSVREAKNFRCYYCGAIFSTPQGINGHLHSRHKLATDEIEYAVDWGITSKIACKNVPSPVASR